MFKYLVDVMELAMLAILLQSFLHAMMIKVPDIHTVTLLTIAALPESLPFF